jgi:hypothetical protein
MFVSKFRVTFAIIAVVVMTTGCQAMITKELQSYSAGHTGCLPEENDISNRDGNVWYATCKGKQYLCSMAGSGKSDTVTNCAPVAH